MRRRLTSPVMVGREAELEELVDALARAAAGRPVGVVVSGEAGVGKTRLMREFTAHARTSGVQVWTGRCLPLADGLVPYAPIVDILRGVADTVGPARLRQLAGGSAARLAVLLADLAGDDDRPGPAAPAGPATARRAGAAPAGPATAPRAGPAGPAGAASGPLAADARHPRLHADLLDLVERLAETPTVLVLEDLHWADRSTRTVLGTLVAGLRRGRLLLVCTYRIGEVPPDHPTRELLVELTRSGLDRIDLRPLGTVETAALMAAITQTEPAATVARTVFARSGGNPFLVEELLAAGAGDGPLPDRLREILLVRVRRLPATAQAALAAIAVAGRAVDHGLLEAVLDEPTDRLLDDLRAAVDERLLVVDGDRYAFRHALVAEAVVADALPGERAGLHRALAQALAARVAARPHEYAASSEQAELAHHWAAAGDADRALVAAVSAGLTAERASAMPEARRHFEHALALWSRADDLARERARERTGVDLVDLYRRAAEASCTVGEIGAALAHIRAAIVHIGPSGDPRVLGHLHERQARYLLIDTADEARTIGAYETAVALVPDESTPIRARVLGGLAGVLLLAGRIREAGPWARQALRTARRADARAEEAHALTTLGGVLTALGDRHDGLATLRSALDIATGLDNAETMFRAYVNLSSTLIDVGEFAESAEVGLRGARVAQRRGAGRSFGSVLKGNAAEALFFLGRWDEMASLLPDGPDLDGVPMQYMVLGCSAALLHTAQGRFADAERHLDTARRALADDALANQTVVLSVAMAELRLWQRRPAEARDCARVLLHKLADRDRGPALAQLLAIVARADADLRTEQADDVVATLAAELPKRASLTPVGEAHLALARAELSRGAGPASRPWATVAQLWADLRCPYLEAYAQWRHAEALLATRGDRARAGRLLEQAHRMAVRLGARPLRDEIDLAARLSRLPLADDAADAGPESPQPSPYGLTRRELEVLGHLAQGRTNRQIARALFISEKTVSIHVSRVLAKLDVHNRAAAAARAHRDGLLSRPGG